MEFNNYKNKAIINLIILIISFSISNINYASSYEQQGTIEDPEVSGDFVEPPAVTENNSDYDEHEVQSENYANNKNSKQYVHGSSADVGASSGNDYITGLLSNGKPVKITPDPNESIDLFSGTLNLHYKDISVPVVPGLNMEYIRSYSSEMYERFPFYEKRHWEYNMGQNGWDMHSGYIVEQKYCNYNDNTCAKVFVQSNGNKQTFFPDSQRPDTLSSKQHYKAIKTDDSYIVTAPNGFKYYFTHIWDLQNAVRYYLTRVETPDASHYVQYHYNDIILSKITSSDPNKVIDIKYKSHKARIEHENYYIAAPTEVYYNNKLMVRYLYEFDRTAEHLKYTLLLKGVTMANGMHWDYNYHFVDLRIRSHKWGDHTHRVFLDKVTHPDAEVTNYIYETDFTVNYQGAYHAVRLKGREHYGKNKIADGKWQFLKSDGHVVDGNTTRLIKLISPSNTTHYLFNGYQSGSLWKLGLPAQIKTYNTNDDSASNLLQQEDYIWTDVVQSNQPYKASLIKSSDVSDANTKRALLAEKIITRGDSVYSNQYSDFDSFDNTKTVKQTGNGEPRVIKQDFVNIEDKNIIGLRTSASINGKNILNNKFDLNGNIVSSELNGRTSTFAYSNGLLSSHTDAGGNTIKYSNYVSGMPELVTYPDGTAESKVVNSDGYVISSTNRNKHSSVFEYNNLGELTKRVSAGGIVTEHDYDAYDKYTMTGNYQSLEKYNIYNQLLSKSENNEYSITNKYDAMGRKIFSSYLSNANNVSNKGHYYKYDGLNRLTSDCYPTSNLTASSCIRYYYKNNNSTKVLYPNGEYKLLSYSALGDPDAGKLISIKEADRTTYINRDSQGYITSVKQGDITKYYKYDKYYNLVKYSEPESGDTYYKYDQAGNLIEKAQNNLVTQYEYNRHNYQLRNVNYADNSEGILYKYDSNGNVLSVDKGMVKQSYLYDRDNKIISETLNLPKKSFTIKYNYNSNGYLQSLVYPDGNIINYSPDDLGRPTKVEGFIDNINYHNNQFWSSFKFGNGVRANTSLDYMQRVTGFSYGALNLNYRYDSNNNLKSMIMADSQDHNNFNYSFDFSYDKTGRLTTANGPWGKINYSFDSNDNITSITNSFNKVSANSKNIILEQPNKDLQFSYNNGRLVKVSDTKSSVASSINTFAYDMSGNITRDNNNKYIYGLDGNLLTSTGKDYVTYEYDGNDNRIVKSVNNHELITVYDHSGHALADYDYARGEHTNYIYFNGQKVAQEVKSNKKSEVSYFYNDALGSPIAMADSNGQIKWRELYQPFGGRLLKQSYNKDNKHWFLGKEQDSTDLSYFGARYYDPNLGRFMSPDPRAVDPEDPRTFNRYSYGANNPFKYVDMDGRHISHPGVMAVELGFGIFAGLSAAPEDASFTTKALCGGIGGVTAVLASPASSEAAAIALTKGYAKPAQYLASSLTDISINTVSNNISSYIAKGDIMMIQSFTSALAGNIIGLKVNMTNISPETAMQAILINKYTTAMSKVAMKFQDYLFGTDNTTISESATDSQSFSYLSKNSSPVMVRYNTFGHEGDFYLGCSL